MNDLLLTHSVTSYECSADHLLKPECFMLLCQEMAELHAEQNGLGYDWSVSNHMVWVEVQGTFEFIRRPQWKEKVTMRTNTGKASALQARRFVEMTDESGKVIARADLLWVLIDITSRRPIPLKRAGLEMTEDCPAITDPFPKAEPVEEGTAAPYAPAHFTALRRDVDFNGHINNSAYLTWTLDTMPAELAADRAPARINIQFKHETFAGQPVSAEHRAESETITRHRIVSEGVLRAEIGIEWA